jgi:phosphatidate cytidylyltransferase
MPEEPTPPAEPALPLDEVAEVLAPVPLVEPPPKTGRAGRDVRVATIVGLALGALVLASLFLAPVVFVGLVVVAVVLGSWEMSGALATKDTAVPLAPVAVGAAAMVIAAYQSGSEALVIALALTVAAVLAWRLTGPADGFRRDATAGVLVTMYLPLLASFAVLLLQPDDGRSRVLAFIVLVVCSDLAGFIVGVQLGRHPMAPSVSPKKSWEGFAGSVVGCVVAGIVIMLLVFDGTWWQGLALGAAAACSATLGDLGESLIKRDIGVKDMSSLLPGHGGIMDRLDSLLATAPIVWVLLSNFSPPA